MNTCNMYCTLQIEQSWEKEQKWNEKCVKEKKKERKERWICFDKSTHIHSRWEMLLLHSLLRVQDCIQRDEENAKILSVCELTNTHWNDSILEGLWWAWWVRKRRTVRGRDRERDRGSDGGGEVKKMEKEKRNSKWMVDEWMVSKRCYCY